MRALFLLLALTSIPGCKQSFENLRGDPSPRIWVQRKSWWGNHEVLRCVDRTAPDPDARLAAHCVRAY